MSGSHAGRRRRRSGSRPPEGPGSARPSTEAPSGGTSKLVIAFALFIGLFFGRVFSNLLGADALFLLDLVIYAGIAGCIALAFRRSARRAVERRQRERLRRRAARSDASVEKHD